MTVDWSYSVVGVGCVVWTILLAVISYIYVRRRQDKLLTKKIDKTNRLNQEVLYKKAEMEKLMKKKKELKSEDSETEEEEEEDDETLGLIKSDDIILEAKTDQSEQRDPFEYCEHIQGEVKRLKQKITQKKFLPELTQSQLDEEREVRRQQMEAIFKLMAEKEGKFGMTSMDEMQSQMKMYL